MRPSLRGHSVMFLWPGGHRGDLHAHTTSTVRSRISGGGGMRRWGDAAVCRGGATDRRSERRANAGLVLTFVGGPPVTDLAKPCAKTYEANVDETDDRVRHHHPDAPARGLAAAQPEARFRPARAVADMAAHVRPADSPTRRQPVRRDRGGRGCEPGPTGYLPKRGEPVTVPAMPGVVTHDPNSRATNLLARAGARPIRWPTRPAAQGRRPPASTSSCSSPTPCKNLGGTPGAVGPPIVVPEPADPFPSRPHGHR